MNYRLLIIILFFFTTSCEQKIVNYENSSFQFENKYKNKGFALVLVNENKISKKLNNRSLNIFHKNLKKNSYVKITNLNNGKSIIGTVKSNKFDFSNFYNSILSNRIAEEIDLDLNDPYVELTLITKDKTFIAKKAKTYDQEKKVAEKAPIDGIQINDLNNNVKKEHNTKKENFSYFIKVADFYYRTSANLMVDRIQKEIKIYNNTVLKLSKTKYRVLIGPFNDIKTLKESFEKIDFLNFENLEILKNV